MEILVGNLKRGRSVQVFITPVSDPSALWLPGCRNKGWKEVLQSGWRRLLPT